ncbi:hypothetical protein JZ751_020790 [Albula glossodonta]|uniref:Uncharacterized protein n=1 Tax=Albula glossodonta TaxID=121402 RepID=A0A8T2PNS6_9TELE|nr:hypothetical protein JZ751_020790 [Albula glossodonta]
MELNVNVGEVQASKVMQYLQDMTAQSPHQGKLKTLYDMLDPEQKDHAVTRDTFHSTMRMWISQCCQSSEWKDLLSTVDELKHARQRLSEQNRSLLRSMAQSEDTNLQLTLEITQLRAKLLSAQRATVRARSLSEELDEARRALKESQERLVQAQASTCTLEELDETLTLLAEKDNSICKRDLREEVEGKLEEAIRQTEMAKKTAAINWWRALKVEEDRTKAQEEASQASHSRDKAMERLQKAEATVQELQDKVHCLQAALRTTSQQTGNDEGREAAFPKVDASHQSKRRDVGIATAPMEESVGRAAERAMETWRKVEAMVNRAVKAVDLLHVSEGRIRQARERVEAASERVERVLSKAVDAEAKLSEVETRILEKPEVGSFLLVQEEATAAQR